MLSLTKMRGKSHLASLPAKCLIDEKHPKQVQIDLTAQELKKYGKGYSWIENFFWLVRRRACLPLVGELGQGKEMGGGGKEKRGKHTQKRDEEGKNIDSKKI